MAFLDGRHGPSSSLCHTATRVSVHGRLRPPGLKSGLGRWLIGKCGQRGEPLMHLQPSSRQGELIALARRLACAPFAPRADRHDCAASFPFDDYADLRAEGLLGLCVPERYGGLGADYETYCLVAEQLAQGNASTALTFNMHCLTMLMMGPIADSMPVSPTVRERHERLRPAKFREVVEDGTFNGQPHSEPVEQGETDTKLGVGGRRFGTTARKVDGGYVVNGRKFFVSLAGCAPYYATPAIRLGDRALDRAHPVSRDSQGPAGCLLPRRVGSDGDARHSQSRHVTPGRVCARLSSTPCSLRMIATSSLSARRTMANRAPRRRPERGRDFALEPRCDRPAQLRCFGSS